MLIFIVLSLLAFVEIVTIFALRSLSKQTKKPMKWFAWLAYWFWTVFIILSIFFLVTKRQEFSKPELMNTTFIIIGFWLMNFTAKAVVMVFYLLNEMTNLFEKLFSAKPQSQQLGRRKFITKTGLAIASIPFGGLFYGMIRGRYQFKVHQQTLAIKNLPSSFVGKSIIQISDLHLGSFPQTTDAIDRAIQRMNELEPDYIFFTGDMINERALEVEPWVESFKQLKAKFGKYSVLGNHDYGDYYDEWAGKPDKIEANVQRLGELQAEMGFQLLRNENISLTQGEDSVRLIGLENWGAGRFSKYGDLKKATDGIKDDEVQILLSHDPSHWDKQVLGKTKIDVALAGHTHGAQVGVELPAIRFSPVQFRYPRWAGLYKVKNQQLYVNRGFGYIGYAGRVGIWPEITRFILQKA